MKKKVIMLLLLVFFIIVFMFLYQNYFNYKTSSNVKQYSVIKQKIEESDLPTLEKQEVIVDELKESFVNDDIVGTIKVNGTSIDDVFVQGTDNNYYLRHSLDGKYNVNGTIFLDYRNDINDKKLIIYGHSYRYSKKGFSQLFSFKDESFKDKNPYITLNIEGSISKWKIFSVMIVHYDDDKYIHTKINFKEDEWQEHINWIKDNSLYDTHEEITQDDRILTIQTCYYNPANSYFIVNAKKVGE